MYKLHLEKSYVPAQTDGEIREITVGGLLREIASNHPDSIARFPQSCMLVDRRSTREQHGLSISDALRQEWQGSKGEMPKGIEGANRFASGKGRAGDFNDL